jgi:hypothetical protein
MFKAALIALFIFAPLWSGAEELLIVPQSDQPLKKSFLFIDRSRNELVLLYEKLGTPSSSLIVERRRVDNQSIIQRLKLTIPGLTMRLADYAPSNSVLLAVLQQNKSQALSMLSINVLNKSVIRSSFYTVNDVKSFSAKKLSVAGMTWDQQRGVESLLINASSPSNTASFFASVDFNGHRVGTPMILNRREMHTDLALDTCSSIFAATTTTVVHTLRSDRTHPLRTPEEISFDPELCQFAIIRRQFTEVPQIYFFNSFLNTENVFKLPGSVAPGLIEDTRNQLIYSPDRKSFFYPTVLAHARLLVNEITQQRIKNVEINTSVDFSGVSMASIGDRVFLLVAGLRVRSYDKTHQLILVKTSPP